ncbi:MAG: type II secretion system F family protein [Alphaproteobacteria bacterium]
MSLFAPLLAALSLIMGGLALIIHGVRMRREALGRRVSLIHPLPIDRTGTIARKARAEETELVRRPFHGLPERERREIVRQLSRWGVPRRYARGFFNGSRLVIAAGLGALGFFTGAQFSFVEKHSFLTLVLVIAMAIIGWIAPIVLIRLSARRRALTSAAGFPDALELLVVCVEAGLALEDGIDRIVIELKHSQPELVEELILTSADLKILSNRDVALANLADRIDTPSVRSVVATLSQTLRYGTPLAQAMRVVAAEMRNNSLFQLEERANRLPVLMTIPMMLFIMPTIFLIVGGPAALKLMDHFLQ